jgi:hypothetical protein
MAAAPFDAPLERLFTPFDQALLREHRRTLVARAHGRVLELGGTGAQVELYPALRVDELTMVGPPAARAGVGRRIARAAFDIHHVGALDALDPPYDTVVAVFVLSARRDLGADLALVRSVLAPDGHVLFLDTSRRRPPGLTSLVTSAVTRPALRMLAPGGVDPPDLPAALRRAGLTVVDLDRFGLPTLTVPLRSLVAGRARSRRARPTPEASTTSSSTGKE